MKRTKIQAIDPPKVNKQIGVILGIVAAAAMAIFALLQLVRFDKFIPEMDAQLPGGYGFAVFVSIVVVFAEIFSIPFLVRMRLSRLAQICSGLLALIPAWIWLLITIWSTGNNMVAVQFSTYVPFDVSWWLIIFNLIWFLFNFYVVWTLGLNRVLQPKKPKK